MNSIVSPAVTRPSSTHAANVLPREVGAPRPHHDEQQHPCPGQAEPGGALGAELVDEPHRRRQAELDAEHRRDRHGGADAGAGAVHGSIEPEQTVHFHV